MAKKIDVYGELNSRTGDGVLADASQIWDSTQGKFQDEINQETANDGLVSVKVEQEFTDEEKAQGRENIGAASQEDVEEKLQQYAKKDGSYEQMIAGGAMNLAGQTVEVNSEMYHPTGVNHASGVAEVRSIKGNTVAWNQLVPILSSDASKTVDGTTFTDNRNGTYTVQTDAEGSTADVDFYPINTTNFGVGHKFFLKGCPSGGSTTSYAIQAMDSSYNNVGWNTGNGIIATANNGVGKVRILIRSGQIITTPLVFRPILIDLTLIYGAGNEPSIAEQFEADYQRWFGKPLTYEEYDAGSLRSVNMAAYKTVGFNQWDEIKEGDGNFYRTKNYIPVLPQTNYYYKVPVSNTRMYFYDSNKNVISSDNTVANRVFTTPQGCKYITFFWQQVEGNVCINISNAERNGEYEPYEEHTYPMPVTTLKGKLNGEGTSVVVFPDGMRSAGTIHDEIYISGGKTYGIKRVGSVDLGTMTWQYISRDQRFASFNIAAVCKRPASDDIIPPILCGKYSVVAYSILSNYNITMNQSGSMSIKDSNLSSSDIVNGKIAKLDGVELIYELTTPEIYEIDDFTLPQNILVDSDGTEEVINAQGKENDSVAPYIDMIYSINAVGALNNLPQGYISEKSMDNFLARLSSAMGGTWTKTWNSTLKEWEFSYTPSANTNSLTQNNEEA